MIRLIKGNVERIVADRGKAERLKAMGYTVISGYMEPEEAADDHGEAFTEDYEKMTVKELRTHAKKQGFAGANAMTKAELLDMLLQ